MKEPIMRSADGVTPLVEIIRLAMNDNFLRIPYTKEGGYIGTDIGETCDESDIHIMLTGHMNEAGLMLQTIEVVYLGTKEKASEFIHSPEGAGFVHSPYSDYEGGYEMTKLAGDPQIPIRISSILKRFFGFTDFSPVEAYTRCEVDYFRKEEQKEKTYN